MGKRHTRISRAWQRPGCRGDCDGTGRTLLVGLVLFAWLAATLRLRQVPPQAVVPRRQRPTSIRHRSICARRSHWMEKSCFTYAASRPIRPRDGHARSVRRYGKLLPIRPSLPIRSAQLKARSTPLLSPATGLS